MRVMTFNVLLLALLAGASVTASPILTSDRENVFEIAPLAEPQTPAGKINRLGDEVVPQNYDLKIIPYLEPDFNFSGVVDIRIFVGNNPVGKVLLHSKELEIEDVNVRRGNRPINSEFEVDAENQLLVIKIIGEQLAANMEYVLQITFSGDLKDDMAGFYRSYYNEDNAVKWLAATQFEATNARKAFPCFDEPRFRTPFQIHIARLPYQVTISNMPVDTTKRDYTKFPEADGRVWDSFQQTQPMATYLVAYIVSEFKHITETSNPISVYARKDVVDKGAYILKKSRPLLDELEAFTGVKYNLPKMDLAAIPDFKAGAMENWGLTTYRERYIVCDEILSSQRNLEAVTLVVAHEFSHQWFGDYVTPTWWNFLWLNEAFATYFEYHIAAMVEPEWRLSDLFVVEIVQPALFSDQFYDHPITANVETVSEIGSLFDLITYDKGGSVLRMLEHMISTKTFKETLNNYLLEGHNNGGSVTPQNLYTALEDQTFKTKLSLPNQTKITDVMKTWTENKGYPLVRVERDPSSYNNHKRFIMKQETYNTPRTEKQQEDQKWIIPITYTTQYEKQFNVTKPMDWLTADKPLQIGKELSDGEWIIVNNQQTGYYRVLYDEENYDLLIKELLSSPSGIDRLNRAQLVDDAFSLALDQKLPYSIPIRIANYLKEERDMIPWFAALRHFNYLYTLYEDTSLEEKLKEYLLNIVQTQYIRINGFKEGYNEDHLLKTGRSTVLHIACRLKAEYCLKSAVDEYKKSSNQLNKVPANLKGVVYCYALQEAENASSIWDQLWSLYKVTEIAYDKDTILSAFGCTKDEQLIHKYLEELLNEQEQVIRKQDHRFVLRSISSSRPGITAGINFISKKLKIIDELNEHEVSVLKNIAHSVSSRAHSEEHLKMLNELHDEASKLNQTKYESLTTSIKEAFDKGSRQKELKGQKYNELVAAVDAELPTQSPTEAPAEHSTDLPTVSPTGSPKPKPSSSNMLTAPSMVLYILVISFLFNRYLQ